MKNSTQEFKNGDTVILTKDMTFYKKGQKAHFIRYSDNPSKAEVVWFGEEDTYNEFGDTEIVPIHLLQAGN